ncbi:MAG: hypothetical protein U0821_02490 [Chloroflexota bacterium]
MIAEGGRATGYTTNWTRRTLVRRARRAQFEPPVGPQFVDAYVLITDSIEAADRAFDVEVQRLARVTPVPTPALVGDRSQTLEIFGEGPFSPGGVATVFRVGVVAGSVLVMGFETPSDSAQALDLARIMVRRAMGSGG